MSISIFFPIWFLIGLYLEPATRLSTVVADSVMKTVVYLKITPVSCVAWQNHIFFLNANWHIDILVHLFEADIALGLSSEALVTKQATSHSG